MTPRTFIERHVHPVWLAAARAHYAVRDRATGFGEAHALVLRGPETIERFRLSLRQHEREINLDERGVEWRGLPVLYRHREEGERVEIVTRERMAAMLAADAAHNEEVERRLRDINRACAEGRGYPFPAAGNAR